MSLIREQ
ncbi:hypothetical protein VCHENC02_2986A, partial [Vibrio harveyi]